MPKANPVRVKALNELHTLLIEHLHAMDVHEQAMARVKRLEGENAATDLVKHFTGAMLEVSAAKVMITRAAFAQAADDAAMPSHVVKESFLSPNVREGAVALAEMVGRRVQVMGKEPFSLMPKKPRRVLSSLHGDDAMNSATTMGFKIGE